MEKIMQVYFGSNGFPYKDKTRETPYPIVAKVSGGSLIMGENNTTHVKFYLGELGGNDHTWVANLKLPDGKLYYRVLESIGFDNDGEFYALLPINDLYTSMKGEVIIGVQGFRGGISYSYDEEDDNYEISGTPDIISTYVIKVLVNYAPLVLPHGSTLTPTAEQQILALLSSKADKTTSITIIGDITTENANDYVFNSIIYSLRQRKFYRVGLTSDLTTHIFANELIDANHFTVNGEQLTSIFSKVIFVDRPNQVIETDLTIGNGANIYKGSIASGNEYITKKEIGVSSFDENNVNIGEKDIVMSSNKKIYIGLKTPVSEVATKNDISLKQDKLTFDDTPTSGSNNPVTSKGIKAYVDQRTGGGVEKIISDSVATTPNVALFNGQQGQLAPSESTYNSIYFVPKGDNTYVEYMTLLKSGSYVWETIGTTDIDLSNYYNKDESDELFAKVDEENTFTAIQTFNAGTNYGKFGFVASNDQVMNFTYDGNVFANIYYANQFYIDRNILPFTTSTRTLGDADNRWKDLHLSGATYYGSTATNNYIITSGDAYLNIKFNNTNIARFYVDSFHPYTNGGVSLGLGTNKWKDLHLSGKVDFGTKVSGRTTSCYIDIDNYDGMRFYSNNTLVFTAYDNAIYFAKPLLANNEEVDLGDNSTHKFRNAHLSGGTYYYGTTTDYSITNNNNTLTFYSGTNRMGTMSLTGILPVGSTRDLGSNGQRWRSLYVNNQIQLGGTTINETELSSMKYNVSTFEYEYDDGTSETLDIRVA